MTRFLVGALLMVSCLHADKDEGDATIPLFCEGFVPISSCGSSRADTPSLRSQTPHYGTFEGMYESGLTEAEYCAFALEMKDKTPADRGVLLDKEKWTDERLKWLFGNGIKYIHN